MCIFLYRLGLCQMLNTRSPSPSRYQCGQREFLRSPRLDLPPLPIPHNLTGDFAQRWPSERLEFRKWTFFQQGGAGGHKGGPGPLGPRIHNHACWLSPSLGSRGGLYTCGFSLQMWASHCSYTGKTKAKTCSILLHRCNYCSWAALYHCSMDKEGRQSAA